MSEPRPTIDDKSVHQGEEPWNPSLPGDEKPPRYFDDHAYSRQFFTIGRQGHTRPTPQFGAPTLCWHVAVWPKQEFDPQQSKLRIEATDGTEILASHGDVCHEYENRRDLLVKDFNRLLRKLQAMGCVVDPQATAQALKPDDAMELFKLVAPPDWGTGEATSTGRSERLAEALKTCNSEFMGFTLWWPDNSEDLPLKPGQYPAEGHLRVRVQAEMNNDYQALTLYIDAGQPWGKSRVFSADKAIGTRRALIFHHVERIRAICGARLRDETLIGKYILPEPDDVSFGTEASALKCAADYLYEGVWTEVCRDFDFDILDIAGQTGGVYANFRSLVMSCEGTDKLPEGDLAKYRDETRATPTTTKPAVSGPVTPVEESVDPAYAGFHRFNGLNGEEPKAVIKAYWPFLRRVRPEADYRDWIACGLFDWRVLFATSLGSLSELDPLDEGDYQRGEKSDKDWLVPAGHLPKRRTRLTAERQPRIEKGWENAILLEAPTTDPARDRPAAFREFFLTKNEPHPRQIGRVVERFNSLGTFRLFALKNWSIIRDASSHIRMYGQELDASNDVWVKRVAAIGKSFERERDAFAKRYLEIVSEFAGKPENAKLAQELSKRLEKYSKIPIDDVLAEITALARRFKAGSVHLLAKELITLFEKKSSVLFHEFNKSAVSLKQKYNVKDHDKHTSDFVEALLEQLGSYPGPQSIMFARRSRSWRRTARTRTRNCFDGWLSPARVSQSSVRGLKRSSSRGIPSRGG